MPIIKSAKKRTRVAKKAAARNRRTKKLLKGALKVFGVKATADKHSKAQSALDKAAKKGLVHKNKVARQKRKLAAAAKAAGVKPAAAAKKKTTAKPAVKKLAAKKAAPAKKSPAKKPATKKTSKK